MSNKGNFLVITLYGGLLGFYIVAALFHKHLLDGNNFEGKPVFQVMKKFRDCYYTGWNFAFQIFFTIIAVTDEAFKILLPGKFQRQLEKTRHFLFATLVFPCSLLVMSIFWSIWHIDRELIFPKAIDEHFPSWLNHTLHTVIALPLVIEVLLMRGNNNFRVPKKQSMIAFFTFCFIYNCVYMSVYFRHGIWLYPVYKVLNWFERIAFLLFQLGLGLIYHHFGIKLLSRGTAKETKIKM